MGDSPIVAHSDLGFDPDKTGLEREPPGVDDVERLTQERVGCPQVKMGVVFGHVWDGCDPLLTTKMGMI